MNGTLSYLPGQRLSRCTCKGESHPGPVHSNGEYVGRASPEIDVFEAQVRNRIWFFAPGTLPILRIISRTGHILINQLLDKCPSLHNGG